MSARRSTSSARNMPSVREVSAAPPPVQVVSMQPAAPAPPAVVQVASMPQVSSTPAAPQNAFAAYDERYWQRSEIVPANFATKGDLAFYSLKADLEGYQTRGNYQMAGDYVLRSDLAGYQTRGNYQLAGQDNTRATSFKVGGNMNMLYPVSFDTTSAWNNNGMFKLSIIRPSVHADAQWKASLNLQIEGHNTNWGHGSDFLKYSYSQFARDTANNNAVRNPLLIGNIIQDPRTTMVIVYLRGNTTYFWSGQGVTAMFLNPNGTNLSVPAGTSAPQVYQPQNTINERFDALRGSGNTLENSFTKDGMMGDLNASNGYFRSFGPQNVGGTFGNTNPSGALGAVIGANIDNSWILHAPNDTRGTLFVAPGRKSTGWDWNKQMTIDKAGNVGVRGSFSAPSVSGRLLGLNLTTHPDNYDGSVYRADGQLQVAVDDVMRLRNTTTKDTGIQFDTRQGAGDMAGPNGIMKITRQGIIFGGPNDATKETNSAQISAGRHVPNSLNIVGMSADRNAGTRKVDIWAEGGMTIRGPVNATNVTATGALTVAGKNILNEINAIKEFVKMP